MSLYILIFFIQMLPEAIELLEKLQESGEVPVHKLQSLKKVLQSEFVLLFERYGTNIFITIFCSMPSE